MGLTGAAQFPELRGTPSPQTLLLEKAALAGVAARGHGNVLRGGAFIWDLGVGARGMGKGSTEVFGCVCDTCSSVPDWYVWF